MLAIEPVKTNKSKIKSTPLMEQKVIPKHPCSIIFNGRSGSGKTVLLSNLLGKKQFYGNYYNKVYLFSGSPDDIFDNMVEEKNRFTDVKTWDTHLARICSGQEADIKKKKIHKSDRVLIIFEDIINYGSWMRRSPYFTSLFIANRHFNCSTWITSQSWTKVPRVCRINANAIFYFAGTEGEDELLATEYAPSKFSKKDMRTMIHYATGDRYSFLYINCKLGNDEKYRKNLDTILKIQ